MKIYMKNSYNIVSIIAMVFIAGALALIGWRGYQLVSQLNAELKIENLYNLPSPTHNSEDLISNIVMNPLATDRTHLEGTFIMPKFEALLEENPDTVGWLKIGNTRIDNVVLQGSDNIFYLEHDFFGNKSVSASMMLDSECDIEKMEKHFVIYGHRMKSGTMMNDILKYEDEDFFYANPIIKFNTIYQNMQWEVFSTYCRDYDFNNTQVSFSSDTHWLSFIKNLQDESYYSTDIKLQGDDVVLTLYTCDYRFNGARYVVHARLVT